MNITYEWSVTNMACYPQYQGEQDVVFSVSCNCVATDQDNPTVQSATSMGTVIPLQAGSTFTPYADLTQNQVLGWAFANGVDQAAIEAQLAANIDAMVNPPVVTLPLPWAITP